MWTMTVRIYNYSTNQTCEYLLGNYAYDQGGYHSSATFLGGSSIAPMTVRFGNQDGVDCVWIGETSTSWSYPVVSVLDFTSGFRGSDAGTQGTGWNITIVTSFGTVATAISPAIRFSDVTAVSVNAPSGYISSGNPWGTANSAFFPNGITTAGGTNWIYGMTYIGNAPGNGAGHEFYTSGSSYSTGNMEAAGSMRAPIFYDRNDTSYYLDPNDTSNLSRLIVNNAVSGAALLVGSTNTSRIINDNARKALVINAEYYPGLHLNAYAGNNTTHGAYIVMSGNLSSGGYRLWTMGIANQNPGIFSIGYSDLQDGNGHYGVGDNWSGNDAHHGRLIVDTSGNTKIRGMLYVNGTSGGISTGNAVYHTGNMDAPNKSGTSYYQTNTWMQMNGTHGIYWPSYYGAHLYVNTTTSYTQFRWDGQKNGYDGVWLSYSAVNGMMYDSGGNGGVYREANGRWYWYHHIGNNCTGISTSTTSSSYRAYIGGSLYAEGDVVAYSDVRKKTDIVTIDNALEKVINLRGVYYTRIDDAARGRQTGVIAQEINEVLPEVVTYAADVDEYGVSYGNIVGVLIEAIKEQQLQIDDLKNKLDLLTQNK
jgi:hypothetical protein